MRKLLPLCILVPLLGACVTTVQPGDWPDGSPPATYFQATWERDESNQALEPLDNYLLWVSRFYRGFSGVPGWLSITEQVLARVPATENERIAARLYDLGARIGGEWAKHNEVRRLNTRSAAVWRDALLEALARDELNDYLDRLDSDVNALLAGELDNDLIRFERYYIDEFDF